MSTEIAPISPLEIRTVSDPAAIAPARKAIEDFCLLAGLLRADADIVGLCVNEAMANVIRHAYFGAADRPIVLSARQVDRGVEICIRDWGIGVNPAVIPKRQYDPLTPGGLGLICMQRCMDDVCYQPQPDGMLLVMAKHRTQAPNPGKPG